MSDDRITSPRNPRLRAALALRDRKGRDAAGLTLVDGARETLRALDAGARVEAVFLCRELVHGPDGEALLARLDGPGGPGGSLGGTDPATARPEVVEIGRAAHDRLAYGDRGDGVVAVVVPPRSDLAALRLPAAPLVAVLVGLEKPGNVGAIVRTADAAGLDALVVADPATDLWNPNAIRASLGTIFALPVAAAPAGAVRRWLRAQGMRVVAARVDGSVPYEAADWSGPVAIVLGSEARGLDSDWDGADVDAVRLPMRGLADSLSVAAAAAVLFYEAQRRRSLAR